MNEIALQIRANFKDYLKKRDETLVEWAEKHWPKSITANIITASRFPLLFLISYLLWLSPPQYFAEALLLIVFSGAMDMLDGVVARAHHEQSRLGEFLDPLADKLTVIVTLWFSGFYKLNAAAMGMSVALTIIEIILLGKRTLNILGVNLGNESIAAKTAGKIKAFAEFVGIFFVLLFWNIDMMNGVAVGETILGISLLLAMMSLTGHLTKEKQKL